MSAMKDFFKNELKMVQLKTGIRQLENIMNLADWEKQLEQLITLMVDETSKPPFDLIGLDVKQRVISNAIVEDKDFIGLNPKFVRRALNTWWHFNKDKYFEKITAEVVQNFQPVSWEERTNWLDKWKESLGVMENKFTSGPKLTEKEIQDEGQEKPKTPAYPSTPESLVKQKLLHDAWIKANHDTYTGEKLPNWKPENEWVQSIDKATI